MDTRQIAVWELGFSPIDQCNKSAYGIKMLRPYDLWFDCLVLFLGNATRFMHALRCVN